MSFVLIYPKKAADNWAPFYLMRSKTSNAQYRAFDPKWPNNDLPAVNMPAGRAVRHRNSIIDAQCDTETIKARTEIGSARRNANDNLFHRLARRIRVRATMLYDAAV